MSSRVLRRAVAWLALCLVVLAGTRVAVALPERCGTPTADTVRAGSVEAVAWFARNQHADGTWLYRTDIDEGADLGGYNWVRHAGVLLSLEQAAAAGIAEAAPVAAAGTPVIVARLTAFGDRLALDDNGVITTGGTSLLTVALGEARLAAMATPGATADPEADERLRGLGRFLAGQVEDDGAVSASASADGRPAVGSHSPFATGQVLFALARLERLYPGEGFGPPARKVAAYLARDRARVEGYVPDSSDHWAAYGLAEVTRWSGPERALRPDELSFARKQLGLVGIQVRYESQRTNGAVNRIQRGRTASGAGVGTLGEALGGWGRVAAAEPALGGQRAWTADRLVCNADVLLRRQVDAAQAAAYPRPDEARGTFPQFGLAQMDDQQHPLSALLAAEQTLRDPEILPRRTPVPEVAALVVLAALFGLNPGRVVAKGPRGGDARLLVGLGTIGGVALLGLVAVAGGPLLRTLDVSVATAVVGAGVAMVVAGLLAMGWSLDAEPGLPGRWGALVPVAVPLVLRPELLLLALAAGAGGQGWSVAAGLGLGAVLATAAAGRWPVDGPAAVAATWIVRLLAAGALAAGIALVVDGVYAV